MGRLASVGLLCKDASAEMNRLEAAQIYCVTESTRESRYPHLSARERVEGREECSWQFLDQANYFCYCLLCKFINPPATHYTYV